MDDLLPGLVSQGASAQKNKIAANGVADDVAPAFGSVFDESIAEGGQGSTSEMPSLETAPPTDPSADPAVERGEIPDFQETATAPAEEAKRFGTENRDLRPLLPRAFLPSDTSSDIATAFVSTTVRSHHPAAGVPGGVVSDFPLDPNLADTSFPARGLPFLPGGGAPPGFAQRTDGALHPSMRPSHFHATPEWANANHMSGHAAASGIVARLQSVGGANSFDAPVSFDVPSPNTQSPGAQISKLTGSQARFDVPVQGEAANQRNASVPEIVERALNAPSFDAETAGTGSPSAQSPNAPSAKVPFAEPSAIGQVSSGLTPSNEQHRHIAANASADQGTEISGAAMDDFIDPQLAELEDRRHQRGQIDIENSSRRPFAFTGPSFASQYTSIPMSGAHPSFASAPPGHVPISVGSEVEIGWEIIANLQHSNLQPQIGSSPIGLPSGSTLPANAPNLVAQQIAAALQDRGNEVGQPIEVALDPPELGRVRLQMAEMAGVLTLTIHAERPETAELMRRHLDLLAQEFSDAGVDAPSVRVSQDGPDGDRAEQQPDNGPEPALTPLHETDEPTLHHAHQPGGNGALDIRL